MRLDKLLEEQGYGPKKAMRRLFQQNKVTVDGVVVHREGRNVDPSLHHIKVDGKRVQGPAHSYYMLNKPQGVVTAVSDSRRQTVIDLIRPEDRTPGLHPVGRLDRDTEGLLLLTDNGQLGYQLVIPEKKVAKRYEAWVNERVTKADVEAFREGIVFIGGTRCKPATLEVLAATERESHVRLEIEEGKFHQVKKMFLAVGKKVTRLRRLSMGPLELDSTLAPGEYRALTPAELEALKPFFQ